MTAMLEQTCRETQRLLDKWRGGYARLWEFQASLDTLTVRVVVSDRPGNLHVVCSPALAITGPVHWEDSRLELRCEETPGREAVFLLRDEQAGFQVTCQGVTATENVEPLY